MMVTGFAAAHCSLFRGQSRDVGLPARKPQRGQHFACAIARPYNGDQVLTIVPI